MDILPRSGVYAIRNLVDGKVYIGSAQNLRHRKSQHFSDLRCGRHASRHLQRAFEKHGAAAFVFDVLEECAVDELIAREQVYIDAYSSATSAYGYNSRPVAASNRGHRFSDETRQRMSDAFNRNRKPMAAESRKRCDETRRGQQRSEDVRRKMSESALSRTDNRLSANTIAAMREMWAQGVTKTAIAARLGINRRTVWRYLRDGDNDPDREAA